MSSVPEDEIEALQALSVCRGTFDGLAAAAIFGKNYEVRCTTSTMTGELVYRCHAWFYLVSH